MRDCSLPTQKCTRLLRFRLGDTGIAVRLNTGSSLRMMLRMLRTNHLACCSPRTLDNTDVWAQVYRSAMPYSAALVQFARHMIETPVFLRV